MRVISFWHSSSLASASAILSQFCTIHAPWKIAAHAVRLVRQTSRARRNASVLSAFGRLVRRRSLGAAMPEKGAIQMPK
jgi:hypothetical protein